MDGRQTDDEQIVIIKLRCHLAGGARKLLKRFEIGPSPLKVDDADDYDDDTQIGI